MPFVLLWSVLYTIGRVAIAGGVSQKRINPRGRIVIASRVDGSLYRTVRRVLLKASL